MTILYNKGNLCIIDGETETQCISYNTLVATYNKLNNTYTAVNSYVLDGEVLKLSRTSRKHQNSFKRDYVPTNAQEVK